MKAGECLTDINNRLDRVAFFSTQVPIDQFSKHVDIILEWTLIYILMIEFGFYSIVPVAERHFLLLKMMRNLK